MTDKPKCPGWCDGEHALSAPHRAWSEPVPATGDYPHQHRDGPYFPAVIVQAEQCYDAGAAITIELSAMVDGESVALTFTRGEALRLARALRDLHRATRQ